jgi:hypothetical protein
MYGESGERYQVLVNNLHNFTKKVEQKKLLIKSNHLKNLKLAKLITSFGEINFYFKFF